MAVPMVVGALAAPVVVGVPEYGPWLVAPVTSELLRGGAEPASVGIAFEIVSEVLLQQLRILTGTWESGPKTEAGVAAGVKVTEKLASALV